MKVLAVNGSPRKRWNTATLLKEALKGAASVGAETELVHLYDLDFKGCTSCFSCKLKNSKSYGRCGYKDDLTPILDRVPDLDALFLGSPIYIGMMTGEMKSFLERLTFPYVAYDPSRSSQFPKKLPTALIFTSGAPEEGLKTSGMMQHIDYTQALVKRIFGSAELLISSDTYQFGDYTKYRQSFDVAAKLKRRKEVFPEDCKKAFELGARLAKAT